MLKMNEINETRKMPLNKEKEKPPKETLIENPKDHTLDAKKLVTKTPGKISGFFSKLKKPKGLSKPLIQTKDNNSSVSPVTLKDLKTDKSNIISESSASVIKPEPNLKSLDDKIKKANPIEENNLQLGKKL